MIDLPDWEGARCNEPSVSPEVFFNNLTQKDAVEYCLECPIMAKCAEFALKNNIPDGVWGGLTEADRRELFKNRNKTRKGIPNRQH